MKKNIELRKLTGTEPVYRVFVNGHKTRLTVEKGKGRSYPYVLEIYDPTELELDGQEVNDLDGIEVFQTLESAKAWLHKNIEWAILANFGLVSKK